MPSKVNQVNLRKRDKYVRYLVTAGQKSEDTKRQHEKSLTILDDFLDGRDYRKLTPQLAVELKGKLFGENSDLSRSSAVRHLRNIQNFYRWLIRESGYKRFPPSTIDYLNPSHKDVRSVSSRRYKDAPTLEQVQLVLRQMPANNEVERRDRAVIALLAATGIRDGALITVKLGHVNLSDDRVDQPSDEVRTKFGKNISTWLFPVGDQILDEVRDWYRYLTRQKCWGPEAPLLPSTKIIADKASGFCVDGIASKAWRSAAQVRRIVKESFIAAGLKSTTPHRFRNMLVNLGYELCGTDAAALKAWSQNLGHEDLMTTLTNYGDISHYAQKSILR